MTENVVNVEAMRCHWYGEQNAHIIVGHEAGESPGGGETQDPVMACGMVCPGYFYMGGQPQLDTVAGARARGVTICQDCLDALAK